MIVSMALLRILDSNLDDYSGPYSGRRRTHQGCGHIPCVAGHLGP